MRRIIVEAWRTSISSYASLNRQQCLEFLKRPGLALYHRDLPFPYPTWPATTGLLSAEDEAAIRDIPAPPPGLHADVLFRISYPNFFHAAPDAERTFIWVVTEFKLVEPSRIGGGLSVGEAMTRTDVNLITCSEWSKAGLVRAGADPARIPVIPLGFNPRTFRPPTLQERDAKRRELGWEGAFVFLNVGTLTWNKGAQFLLQAFAVAAQHIPNAVLAIKGSQLIGSDKRLEETLATIPPQLAAFVRPRLRFIGDNLTDENMARIFGAADAYVSPYHAEGFNLPVLEAAACGLPVIVSAGGPTDEFTHESFALRIPSREVVHPEVERTQGPGATALVLDGEACIAHMHRVATDAALREAARRAGPAYVLPRFTWERSVDRLLQVMFPSHEEPRWTPRSYDDASARSHTGTTGSNSQPAS